MTLAEWVAAHPGEPVRLHLGCGGTRWRDFVNIDLHPDEGAPDSSRAGCVADVVADMRALGLPDDSVDEIFTSHTIDHFVRWEAIEMLADWHRMLRPGGTLVTESADLMRCVLWLFHPRRRNRQRARSQFYGNQWDRIDFETHRYVWTARELAGVLREVGFRDVRWDHRPWTHHAGRDMHVVAVK